MGEAIASPLRKFEPSSSAPAEAGDLLTGLPIEVGLLFGTILLAGVAGLIKQSGVLSQNAPTIGLGESRDDLAKSAAHAVEDEATMTQAEQEKKYFAILANEAKAKRGGSSESCKKKK